MLGVKRIHFIIGTILLQSFTFLCGKYATIYGDFFIPLMSLGYLLIVLRAYVWQKVLMYNKLSKVYPFNSLVQVVLLLYSYFLFDESITVNNIIGSTFMMLGIVIIGKSK